MARRKIQKPEVDFPEPMHHLDDYSKQFYWDIVGHLYGAGMLEYCDALMLTILAKNAGMMHSLAKLMKQPKDFVQVFPSGATNVTGHFTAYEKAAKQVMAISAKMGLSPADREKILAYAKSPDEGDAYDQLSQALQGQ